MNNLLKVVNEYKDGQNLIELFWQYLQNIESRTKPEEDIFNLEEKNIPYHDIICAGFPCQPFSSAGKKLGMDDDRSKVYDKLLSIINKKKPKILLLENVKNLTIIDNGEVIKKIISDLTKLGYNVSYSILNTYNFGLPQNRERLFQFRL